jgi:sigma-B regulation protein RsbU (phosphoserine phosphatase)
VGVGSEHAWLAPTGPLFGFGQRGWTTGDVQIGPSSLLIVYTDGLVEARNEQREFYGERGLLAMLDAGEHDNAEAIVEAVLVGLTAFRPGRLDDDVTLVVLCHGG